MKRDPLPIPTKQQILWWYHCDLQFCACGDPDAIVARIKGRLENPKCASWDDLLDYVLDTNELTEHGSSINFVWLTDKGRMVLKGLREHGCNISDWEEEHHGWPAGEPEPELPLRERWGKTCLEED